MRLGLTRRFLVVRLLFNIVLAPQLYQIGLHNLVHFLPNVFLYLLFNFGLSQLRLVFLSEVFSFIFPSPLFLELINYFLYVVDYLGGLVLGSGIQKLLLVSFFYFFVLGTFGSLFFFLVVLQFGFFLLHPLFL
jgi:hypothetical protein